MDTKDNLQLSMDIASKDFLKMINLMVNLLNMILKEKNGKKWVFISKIKCV